MTTEPQTLIDKSHFKDQFSPKNAPVIYQIQKSLASLSQGTMTVFAYYTKLKILWDELETYRTLPTCNQMKAHNEQKEEDQLMQFLMGLNDTYNIVRTDILMMSPLPNVHQAYSFVIQEETQRHMMSESTENFSIAATVHSHPSNVSGNHDAYANAAGLHPFSNASINSVFTNSWILDSGATDHIIFDSKHFTKIEPSPIPHINLPTGSSASITSTGTVTFNPNITLNNVLCVPSFRLNLLSVSKVTSSLNCCPILFPNFCILQDLATGKMISSGKQHDGLYYMSPLQQTPLHRFAVHFSLSCSISSRKRKYFFLLLPKANEMRLLILTSVVLSNQAKVVMIVRIPIKVVDFIGNSRPFWAPVLDLFTLTVFSLKKSQIDQFQNHSSIIKIYFYHALVNAFQNHSSI